MITAAGGNVTPSYPHDVAHGKTAARRLSPAPGSHIRRERKALLGQRDNNPENKSELRIDKSRGRPAGTPGAAESGLDGGVAAPGLLAQAGRWVTNPAVMRSLPNGAFTPHVRSRVGNPARPVLETNLRSDDASRSPKRKSDEVRESTPMAEKRAGRVGAECPGFACRPAHTLTAAESGLDDKEE